MLFALYDSNKKDNLASSGCRSPYKVTNQVGACTAERAGDGRGTIAPTDPIPLIRVDTCHNVLDKLGIGVGTILATASTAAIGSGRMEEGDVGRWQADLAYVRGPRLADLLGGASVRIERRKTIVSNCQNVAIFAGTLEEHVK